MEAFSSTPSLLPIAGERLAPVAPGRRPGVPRHLRALLGLLATILVGTVAGCDFSSKPQVDHLAKAKALAAQITESTGKTDYSSSDWEPVAQELQMVPEDSADSAEAERWLKEIQQARHAALFAVQEKDGGSVAYKVKPRATGGSRYAGSGLPPPPDHIDVGAIERRVSGHSTRSTYSGSRKTQATRTGHGGPVIIYTTSWCPVCKAAKAHLRSRGVSFIEKDVEKDPAANAEKERLAPGSGVPVISVGGKILVGFDAAALDKML